MALLSDLVALRERVAASPGRLEKRRLVAQYLRGLSPEDLTRAVTYLSGRAFPASDPRVLNVRGLPAPTAAALSPAPLTLADVAQAFGEESFAKLNLKYDESFVLYRGKGCVSCAKTGYRGRAGIHELLIATDEMKRLIQTKARVAEMLEMAKVEGMTTLVQDGVLKTLTGMTDFRQVKAVAIK